MRSSPLRYCLPALFTLANLGCGAAAIWLAWQPTEYELATQATLCAWLVIAAMVADGCDGPLARWLYATSRLGNVADSVADWVSFGLAPAMLLCLVGADAEGHPSTATLVVAASYALATFLRLQAHSRRTLRRGASSGKFMGLPSPAAACVALGAVVLESQRLTAGEASHALGLLVMMIAIAVLMITPIRYPKLATMVMRLSPPLRLLSVLAICLLVGVIGPWAALVLLSSFYAVFPLLRVLVVGTSDDANVATRGGG